MATDSSTATDAPPPPPPPDTTSQHNADDLDTATQANAENRDGAEATGRDGGSDDQDSPPPRAGTEAETVDQGDATQAASANDTPTSQRNADDLDGHGQVGSEAQSSNQDSDTIRRTGQEGEDGHSRQDDGPGSEPQTETGDHDHGTRNDTAHETPVNQQNADDLDGPDQPDVTDQNIGNGDRTNQEGQPGPGDENETGTSDRRTDDATGQEGIDQPSSGPEITNGSQSDIPGDEQTPLPEQQDLRSEFQPHDEPEVGPEPGLSPEDGFNPPSDGLGQLSTDTPDITPDAAETPTDADRQEQQATPELPETPDTPDNLEDQPSGIVNTPLSDADNVTVGEPEAETPPPVGGDDDTGQEGRPLSTQAADADADGDDGDGDSNGGGGGNNDNSGSSGGGDGNGDDAGTDPDGDTDDSDRQSGDESQEASESPIPDDAKRHRGKFPPTAGPNEVLYRANDDGQVTHYQKYDENGLPIKRVDVEGKSHGGVPTPHVVEFEQHTNPQTGETFIRAPRTVRPAEPWEIP